MAKNIQPLAATTPQEVIGTPPVTATQMVGQDGQAADAGHLAGTAGNGAVTPSLAYTAEGGTDGNSVVEAARANEDLTTNPGAVVSTMPEAKGKIVKTENNSKWDDFWADTEEGHIAARAAVVEDRPLRKLTCTATGQQFYRVWKETVRK